MIHSLFICIVKRIYIIAVMIAHKFANILLGKSKGILRLEQCFSSRIPVFSSMDSSKGDSIKIVHTKDAAVHLPSHKLAKFL